MTIRAQRQLAFTRPTRVPQAATFLLHIYQSSWGFCRLHPHWYAAFLESGFDHHGRFEQVPFGDLTEMAQTFRRRVLGQFLHTDSPSATAPTACCAENTQASASAATSVSTPQILPAWGVPLSTWRETPPVSLAKVSLEEQTGKVLFHTRFNSYFGQNLKLCTLTDFIAQPTQIILPKGTHNIRSRGRSGAKIPRSVLTAATAETHAPSSPTRWRWTGTCESFSRSVGLSGSSASGRYGRLSRFRDAAALLPVAATSSARALIVPYAAARQIRLCGAVARPRHCRLLEVSPLDCGVPSARLPPAAPSAS